MEIILVEKIEKLGDVGDLVKVKNGYGRNLLLRQNKALRATEENKKLFAEQKKEILAKNNQIKTEAKKIYDKINNQQVVILTHASDEGRLFGSIMPRDIAVKLSESFKIEVKKSQIVLASAIREVGVFEVKLRIHADFLAIVKVNVARSEKEAADNLKDKKAESADENQEVSEPQTSDDNIA